MTSSCSLEDLVLREARLATNFATLSEACEGAWPAWLRGILVARDDADARRLLASARSTPGTRIKTDRRLPLAHPLDADWRFTRESADRILDILLADTPAGEDILLIAMPTVALAAHDRGHSRRIVIASRASDPVDAALRLAMPSARFASLGGAAKHRFNTIALDPPWYDDVASDMIAKALAHIGARGCVYVCAPDRFTRPSAAPKLGALQTNPEGLGFAATKLIERMRYATPFFELRCLEANGLNNISARWRTGVLIACTPLAHSLAVKSARSSASNEWREMTHGPIRLWLRRAVGVLPGTRTVGISTSISRTDPSRLTARLWTSGNTIASHAELLTADDVDAALRKGPDIRRRTPLADAIEAELAAMRKAVEFE